MQNIPPKPKKPTNPTFSYIQAKRNEYVEKNPGKKVTEVTKDLSEEYK